MLALDTERDSTCDVDADDGFRRCLAYVNDPTNDMTPSGVDDAMNLYDAFKNDPINFTDPNGQSPEPLFGETSAEAMATETPSEKMEGINQLIKDSNEIGRVSTAGSSPKFKAGIGIIQEAVSLQIQEALTKAPAPDLKVLDQAATVREWIEKADENGAASDIIAKIKSNPVMNNGVLGTLARNFEELQEIAEIDKTVIAFGKYVNILGDLANDYQKTTHFGENPVEFVSALSDVLEKINMLNKVPVAQDIIGGYAKILEGFVKPLTTLRRAGMDTAISGLEIESLEHSSN